MKNTLNQTFEFSKALTKKVQRWALAAVIIGTGALATAAPYGDGGYDGQGQIYNRPDLSALQTMSVFTAPWVNGWQSVPFSGSILTDELHFRLVSGRVKIYKVRLDGVEYFSGSQELSNSQDDVVIRLPVAKIVSSIEIHSEAFSTQNSDRVAVLALPLTPGNGGGQGGGYGGGGHNGGGHQGGGHNGGGGYPGGGNGGSSQGINNPISALPYHASGPRTVTLNRTAEGVRLQAVEGRTYVLQLEIMTDDGQTMDLTLFPAMGDSVLSFSGNNSVKEFRFNRSVRISTLTYEFESLDTDNSSSQIRIDLMNAGQGGGGGNGGGNGNLDDCGAHRNNQTWTEISSPEIAVSSSCPYGGNRYILYQRQTLMQCVRGREIVLERDRQGPEIGTRGECNERPRQSCVVNGVSRSHNSTWYEVKANESIRENAVCRYGGEEYSLFQKKIEKKCWDGAVSETGNTAKGDLIRRSDSRCNPPPPPRACGTHASGTTWTEDTNRDSREVIVCGEGRRGRQERVYSVQLRRTCNDGSISDVEQRGPLRSEGTCKMKCGIGYVSVTGVSARRPGNSDGGGAATPVFQLSEGDAGQRIEVTCRQILGNTNMQNPQGRMQVICGNDGNWTRGEIWENCRVNAR